jgi:L-iditol 2-dehydrogenase
MLGVTKLAPGPGNVGLSRRDRHEVGAGQVALQVHAVGVCGTDLHIQAGEYPSVPPVTMGHEVCGTVSELGAGVDPAWEGRRVVVETYYSTCGRCRYCRTGAPNMCAERRSIGTHVDGGMAPRLVLPAHCLHEPPVSLADAAAALSEPVACVCQSLLETPAVRPGDAVLVVGPGAIGLVAAQVARAAGGDVTVIGTPRDETRLALADQLGFTTVLAGETGTEAYDVAVECSGADAGIRTALEGLMRRGTFVLMGLRGADVTVPFDLICFHELRVTSGFASTPGSWRRAMRLLDAGAVRLAPLISDVVAISDWKHAFDASRAGSGVKYVIDPREGQA